MTEFIRSDNSFEGMLANLRIFVVSENATNEDTYCLDQNIVQRFRNCRNAFSSQSINPNSFLDHSKLIWEITRSLPETHSLHLPPLYTNNEQLKKILQHASNELLKREDRKVYSDSDNCGHLVIGGVEGVGKSTIVKAIAIACAVLLTRMTPVYFLIKEEQQSWVTISTLLQRRFPSHLDSKFDNVSVTTMIQHLSQHDIEVAFIMDEFQRLFVENVTDSKGKQIVQQMADASRCCAALGIITGSSVNLRSYLFKWIDGQDPWRTQGYPNFNGTLYKFYFVPALRTIESLRIFLSIRYPDWKLSDFDVQDILKFTGGVGRIVHAFYLDQTLYSSLNRFSLHSTTEPTEHSLAISLQALNDERRLSREQIMANDYYRSLLTYFAAKHPENLYSSLAKSEIKHFLKELFAVSELEAIKIIDKAVDCSVLYQEDFNIQVTIPYDIEYLHTHALSSIPLLIKLTVVSFMVRGIVEGEKVIDVNAGTALESLVRGNVLSLIGDDRTKRGVGNIELITIDQRQGFRVTYLEGIQYLQLTSLPFDIVSTDAFKPFFGIAFKWKNEIGLDAWTIVPNRDSVEQTYELIGWQCKGGRQNVRVTPGLEKTMVKNYVDHGDLSKVDASTIAGISVKAQVGFLILMDALEKIGVHATKVTLLLTTTKLVTTEAMKTRSISFDVNLVKAVTGKKGQKMPMISLLTITGTSWITDCVDGEASEFCQTLFGRGFDVDCKPVNVSLCSNNTVELRKNSNCVVC